MYRKIEQFTHNNRDYRNLLKKIRKRILNVENLFSIRPSLFLTESDIKCNIYSEIIKIQSLNPKFNPPLVYTELGEVTDSNNSIFTDMTIFIPGTLNLDMVSEQYYSDKGYYAVGKYIDIEFKLYKNNNFSNKDEEKLLLDKDKLLQISTLHYDNHYLDRGRMIYGFMIIVVTSNRVNERLLRCIENIKEEIEDRNIELILFHL